MLCLRCSRLARSSPLSNLSSLRNALPKAPLISRYLPLHLSSPAYPIDTLRPSQSRPLTLSTIVRPALPRPRLETSTSTSPILSSLSSRQGATSTAPSGPSASLLLVRGAKRDTYDPSHRVRKRRHGFLARLRSRTGRKTINRRRTRGRRDVSH
ncbi:putative ribosomal protein L34 [Elsinoe fawcettii]|nr:putative ribosomal protein L34 [Elsinoe fawcettii]